MVQLFDTSCELNLQGLIFKDKIIYSPFEKNRQQKMQRIKKK